MGNEMDWMAMYQCGQTWMGAMEWFNQPMIPQNWTVPAGSEQLLGLWMESKEDLDYFMMDPYNALMKYAKEWMINRKWTPKYNLKISRNFIQEISTQNHSTNFYSRFYVILFNVSF